MQTALKPNQIRIRISEEDFNVFAGLAEDTGLSMTDVVTAGVHSLAKAIVANNHRMPLPLRLRISEDMEVSPSARRR